VDISGFTKLSEYFSKMGTEGCEEFSTLVSKFLATMSEIIERHHGDIDCFAGDALLVVFSEVSVRLSVDHGLSRRNNYGGGGGKDRGFLRAAVRLALNCMIDICAELNGVMISPNSPSLNIHGALAAGNLHAVECGRSIGAFVRFNK
jgi:class 3 adenylate cyclase